MTIKCGHRRGATVEILPAIFVTVLWYTSEHHRYRVWYRNLDADDYLLNHILKIFA